MERMNGTNEWNERMNEWEGDKIEQIAKLGF